MRLKFPDISNIHAQFENPDQLKGRAKEISQMAYKFISKLEQPKLFGRLKDRILEIWKT